MIDWDKYDAIVISDYCKGFVNQFDIQYIAQSHPLTFLDTKRVLGDWADKITFIKINSSEYENNRKVFTTYQHLLNKCIVTKGPQGCLYQGKIYPTKKVDVKDVSGAGDTFLAGLVENYVTTKNIETAISFAQKCTTTVVQKLGVSTI